MIHRPGRNRRPPGTAASVCLRVCLRVRAVPSELLAHRASGERGAGVRALTAISQVPPDRCPELKTWESPWADAGYPWRITESRCRSSQRLSRGCGHLLRAERAVVPPVGPGPPFGERASQSTGLPMHSPETGRTFPVIIDPKTKALSIAQGLPTSILLNPNDSLPCWRFSPREEEAGPREGEPPAQGSTANSGGEPGLSLGLQAPDPCRSLTRHNKL